MKTAIMQPYFLPYIGYWQLINAVDKFIVYDNIQFSKSGWFHRNYFLINGKKKLFTIPIKKDSDFLDVRDKYLSQTTEKAIKKILSQISHGYRKAPFYFEVVPIIENIFLNPEKNLFEYIYSSIIQILKFLDIGTEIIISSEIDINHSLKAQERVIAINKEVSSTIYYNPIGGINLYDKEAFKREGIKLIFLESNIPEYSQFSCDFVPSLSILDIMMYNSKDDIKKMLNSYKIIGG